MSAAAAEAAPALAGHGASRLPAVRLDVYNSELRDDDGFVGDRASNRAFRAILEEWRESVRQIDDDDPIGEEPSEQISKKKLDKLIADGDPEAAGVLVRHGRGVCPGIRDRDPPLSAPQGMARHAAHRGRRRVAGEPHRRGRDRPHCGDPQERKVRNRIAADPASSR